MSLHTATKLCLQAFDKLCEDLKTYGKNQDSLENVLDEGRRLRVWASNLGALAKGHSALDWRLRDASVMRTGIMMLLQEIKKVLDSSSALVSGTTLASSADDSSTDADYDDAISLPSDDDLSESSVHIDDRPDIMFESITQGIKSLYKLAYRIRNPNLRTKSSRASRYKEISKDTELDIFGDHFKPLDRAHVVDLLASLRLAPISVVHDRTMKSINFSHSDEVLISRLAGSNVTRRRQFRYWEKHSERLAAENDANVPLQTKKVAQISPDVPLNELFQPLHSHESPALSSTSKSIHTTTEATRFDPQLDASVSETQSVVSLATTARDLEGRVADLPAPPAGALDGRDFVCPYCFVLCPPRHGKSRAWRAHIIQDLQPYICTYTNCVDGNRLYGSRQAWFDHESMAHRQCWRCRDHPSLDFKSQESLNKHLQNDHENILSQQARSDFSEISESTFDDDRDKCPFCLIATAGILNMPNHLANHLERIATFSLPRYLDDPEEVLSRNSDKAIVAMSRTERSHFWQSGSISFFDNSDADDDSHGKPLGNQVNDALQHPGQALDATAQGEESYNMLQRALSQGQSEKVQSLLHQGSAADCPGGYYGNTLHAAASEGNYDIAKSLLDEGADVHAQGGYYGNAIQAASLGGHEKIIRVLLDNGADVNVQDGFYGNAIQAASFGGHERIVQMLLDNGAEVNAQDGFYGNAIQAASFGGHERIVRMLLDNGADVNAQGGWYGNALQAACTEGHEKIVEMLLDHDANVNAGGVEYRSPLEAASSEGHDNIVQMLLDHGALIDYGSASQRAADGRGPVSWAAQNGHTSVVKLLLSAGAPADYQDSNGRTPLYWAAEYGHESIVELLLSAGARPDRQDNSGQTPLSWAAGVGHESIMNLLMSAGAIVNCNDSDRRTPISWAAENGHGSVVGFLIQEGAIVDCENSDGRTPLSWAAEYGHKSVVELLLDARAAVNRRDIDGHTPIWWAASRGQELVVKLLVSAGAIVDCQDRNGRTLLSWAASWGQGQVAEFLIRVGKASVNCKDNDGRTPLSWAAEHGAESVVESIIATGATLESRDTDGRTPLSWAAEKGKVPMVEMLIAAGAALEVKDKYGRTPMWWAAENWHHSIVALLISAGAAADEVGLSP